MMLAVARDLLARGLSLIPLDHPDDTWVTDPDSIGKTPAVRSWKEFQSKKPTDALLQEWFGNGHKRNSAIVAGEISGVVMVDGDSKKGLDWMREHLPATPMRTKTAKGEHWYYRHPAVRVPNKVGIRTGDPAIKIDVRGDGGYVVAPGSLHATRITYERLGDWPPISELPTFEPKWIELEGDPSPKTEPMSGSIPRGRQHRTLFEEGCRLRRRGWDEAEIADSLWSLHKNRSEGPNVPHERSDIEKIAQSICRQYEPTADTIAADDENEIVMRGGALTSIVNRAEAALLSMPIYQRGGLLTRTIRLDKPLGGPHDVRRAAGSTMLTTVKEPWLVEQMGRVLAWRKVNAKGDLSPADPQPIYARTLLARGEWAFHVLRGVITAPTLGRDGRIIETPGFDEASGLLLDFQPGHFQPVPPEPTKEDARLALKRLSYPLRAFPFVDDAARSVALSALLTALVRTSLRTAPLHAYDAPTAGSGKSILAEMPGLLATGVKPPALSQGKTPEEDEKRLSTVLFAGDPVIHIDNCERPVQGDFLCSMLTQEIVQARILGLSERRVLPCTALVCASGNNLTFAGDAARRGVTCRLDAQMERPDTRTFDFDCHAEVIADRVRLVIDGLTILRAYLVSGQAVTLKPMGSFDDWQWIRGALVWLECADPADTRLSIIDNDPRRDELMSVMELWERALGDAAVEVASIQAGAERDGADTTIRELRNRLIEVACRGTWNSKSVGWWLRRYKDRVINERCFRHDTGTKLWTLVVPRPPRTGLFDEE